jgi:hypothetical protein
MTTTSRHLLRHSELVSGSIAALPDAATPQWMLKQVQHDDVYLSKAASQIRHPELVSGSMAQRFRQTPRHRKVGPFGIGLFDKLDLPRSMPALELLFARDGALHSLEELCMNETIDAVARRETDDVAGTMLPHSGRKVRGDADIQRPACLAGENVGARVSALHGAFIAAPWMLKQVQHDVVRRRD